MVHPFELRDHCSFANSATRCVSFDSRTYLTHELHPLRYATLAGLLPNLYPETQILDHPGDGSGFAQLTHRRGCPSSHLRLIAPQEIFTDGLRIGIDRSPASGGRTPAGATHPRGSGGEYGGRRLLPPRRVHHLSPARKYGKAARRIGMMIPGRKVCCARSNPPTRPPRLGYTVP